MAEFAYSDIRPAGDTDRELSRRGCSRTGSVRSVLLSVRRCCTLLYEECSSQEEQQRTRLPAGRGVSRATAPRERTLCLQSEQTRRAPSPPRTDSTRISLPLRLNLNPSLPLWSVYTGSHIASDRRGVTTDLQTLSAQRAVPRPCSCEERDMYRYINDE